MAGKPGRGSDQFMVRLPDGMRERLRDAADANNRSMNAEIVARLEHSFEAPMVDRAVIDALAQEMLSEVRKQLAQAGIEPSSKKPKN